MPVFQQNGMAREVVALGVALGDDASPSASFYPYITPSPDGIETADFGVEGAAYLPDAGLISLPWDVVRASDDPGATIVRFGDAVYEAGGWPDDLTGPRHDGWYASTNLVFS
jgi:hypothetical protein